MNKDNSFQITGPVTKKYVNQGATFGTVTIEVKVPGRQYAQKVDVKTFENATATKINDIGLGQVVTLSGTVGCDKLKDKAGAEIKVDGYNVWMPVLRLDTIEGGGGDVAGPSSGSVPF